MMMMMKKKKKNSSSSSSSSTVVPNDLTEDLILDIFTHLPPISLLRFKCLSKTFHSLISNPDFLRSNAVHQFRRQDPSLPPIPPRIIFIHGCERSGDVKVFRVSPPSPGDGDGDRGDYSQLLVQNLIDYGPEHDQPNDQKVKFSVIDSCNGLLLYSNYVELKIPPVENCIWYVCNPITKDYIKLPPLEVEQGFKIKDYSILKKIIITAPYYSSPNLVFDPSLSLTYKVVIWLNCWEDYREDYRLYVYSSETRSWRLSVKITINDMYFRVIQNLLRRLYFRAVVLNGVLYWTTPMHINMDVSLCYDIGKDSVWTLKFPKMPVECVRRKLHYFGVCGGGLRLIENYYKQWHGGLLEFLSSFDVMEMNQLQLQQQYQDHQDGNIDRDLWTVKYRVNIGEEGYYANLIREKSLSNVYILDLYKTTTKARGDSEEVLLCLNYHTDSLVISFNLSDNTFGKELRHNGMCRGVFYGFTSVLLYANITLFPLLH